MSNGLHQFGLKTQDCKETVTAFATGGTVDSTFGIVTAALAVPVAASSIAGAASYTLVNNRINSGSIVIVTVDSSNVGEISVGTIVCTEGQAVIRFLNNTTAGGGSTSQVVFRFFVLNGSVY